ncbi:superoxide dismutase family protein [Siminovitchia fordii]|uniref:superoxide dismutase family protein n=1 Tax=Siminovitchia fordii TaxID=254759 RepID=UPI00035E23C1|nr:superoxide dismutase family protein [Siminovitchia fordii]
MRSLIVILTLTFVMAGCTNQPPTKFDVDIKNADGDSIGKITFEEQAEGIKLKGEVKGLPPGELAMHIHDKGKCDPPDFASAGDHFNPDKKEHGLLNSKGPHAGDLPNLTVAEDGKSKVDVTAKNVTFEEAKTSLYTKDGTSLVIHEQADDGMSQPAGDSGNRIACGEITKNRKPAK